MSRFGSLFGSMAVKLGAVMALMGLGTLAAIAVAYFVFVDLSQSVATLTTKRVPEISIGRDVIVQTVRLKDGFAELVAAENSEQLQAALDKNMSLLSDFTKVVEKLPDEQREAMSGPLADVRIRIQQLVVIRAREFSNDYAQKTAQTVLADMSAVISRRIRNLSRVSFERLSTSGSETVRNIGIAFEHLVEEDLAQLQTALALQADLNLASGIVVGLSGMESSNATRDTIRVAEAALSRAEEALPAVTGHAAPMIADPDLIRSLIDTSRSALANPAATSRLAPRVLDLREESDAALTDIIDQIRNHLEDQVDDATVEYRFDIHALVDKEARIILDASDLSTQIFALLSQAQAIGVIDGLDDLDVAEAELRDAWDKMKRFTERTLPDYVDEIDRMRPFIAPETGIAASRREVLLSRREMATSTRNVAALVGEIALETANYGNSVVDNIEIAGAALNGNMEGAQRQLLTVGAATAIVFVLAQVGIQFLLIRPLKSAISATQKLARRDRSALDAVSKTGMGGEIGQLMNALQVFRDNMIEAERLAKREKDAAEYEARQAQEAAENRREAERRSAEALLEEERRRGERQREEQRRRAEQEAERRSLEEMAEAERRARHEEQAKVVSELANALSRLASGDLASRIDRKFPKGYEPLRADFNATVSTLSEVMSAIRESAANVQSGSSGISASTSELSSRIESSAQSLQTAARTLDGLTQSTRVAAEKSRATDEAARKAKSEADRSSGIVRNTEEAMQRIADSSESVTKIISVIEDIAFQTNLLALNAGVEAARAGEAGRGFAVVASEVRALAQRSSDAAREIGQLLSQSGEHTRQGVELVGQTGAFIEAIATAITLISQNVTEIAESVEAQSAGLQEINATTTRLDSMTQDNAAAFEETTTAAASLSAEARTLAASVERFSLDHETRDVA
ncbi:methyl-accepting chemotaxis protein [Amaricoccus macauensis]|uniref:methyl-accepting chemotaxis protein n=1 Tax=Amaricoccus macauensis TaxID=57001 RepID=UPI003C7C71D7